jgi:hypothetical protein
MPLFGVGNGHTASLPPGDGNGERYRSKTDQDIELKRVVLVSTLAVQEIGAEIERISILEKLSAKDHIAGQTWEDMKDDALRFGVCVGFCGGCTFIESGVRSQTCWGDCWSICSWQTSSLLFTSRDSGSGINLPNCLGFSAISNSYPRSRLSTSVDVETFSLCCLQGNFKSDPVSATDQIAPI